MDRTEKFLNSINRKQRILIENKISLLIKREINGLDIKKIKGTDFFRMRVGKIRIIFHYKKSNFVLEFVGRRNDKIYKKIMRKQ